MKILLLAPHTDDEMGGLPAYFYYQQKQSVDLKIISFSCCEATMQALGYDKNKISKEEQNALAAMGIQPNAISCYHFPVRHFSEHRQEILDILITMKHTFAPDIVIGPTTSDMHQDHQVVCNEMLRCFKTNATILGFIYLWNLFQWSSTVFFEINDAIFNQMISFVAYFESQKHKRYMQKEYIKAQFITNGIQIGKPLAVAYEGIRLRNIL